MLDVIIVYPNSRSRAGRARTDAGIRRHAYGGSAKPSGLHWHAQIEGSTSELLALGATVENGVWRYIDSRGNSIPCIATDALVDIRTEGPY